MYRPVENYVPDTVTPSFWNVSEETSLQDLGNFSIIFL